jgi:hypothetical protein
VPRGETGEATALGLLKLELCSARAQGRQGERGRAELGLGLMAHAHCPHHCSREQRNSRAAAIALVVSR